MGDYLFARSFQLMVETGSLRVLDILANASAVIAEGEVLQLTAAQDLATTEEIYLKVIRGKTAALFSAATEVGGVIAGVDEAMVRALHTYGDALGIAFQIADDLLDYGGSSAAIGKNTGDDFRERKLTLPVIKAVARADAAQRAFWVRVIEKGDQREGDLEQALALLDQTGAMQAARDDAMAWADTARTALDALPDASAARDAGRSGRLMSWRGLTEHPRPLTPTNRGERLAARARRRWPQGRRQTARSRWRQSLTSVPAGNPAGPSARLSPWR